MPRTKGRKERIQPCQSSLSRMDANLMPQTVSFTNYMCCFVKYLGKISSAFLLNQNGSTTILKSWKGTA